MMVRSLRRHASSRGADVYWDGNLVKSCDTDDNGRPGMIVIGTGAQNPDQFGRPCTRHRRLRAGVQPGSRKSAG
jgi:hypothetical protein